MISVSLLLYPGLGLASSETANSGGIPLFHLQLLNSLSYLHGLMGYPLVVCGLSFIWLRCGGLQRTHRILYTDDRWRVLWWRGVQLVHRQIVRRGRSIEATG